MKDVYEQIRKVGILPVIKLNDPGKAAVVGKALIEGGIPLAEVTFRADGAAEAIKLMKQENPDMLIGAGTVLNIKQAEAAIDAGAQFVVAPGFNKEVIKYVLSRNTPMFPGVVTPSEIEAAIGMGLNIVKFFPAELYGGVAMIKALANPYSNITFIPTGGINARNLDKYLSESKVCACGGSWMVKESLIDNNQFSVITELCKEAIDIKERVRK